MSFILGMDTGGTYTDGVIVDTADRHIVCKAKALTTKDDLTVGIENCIKTLDFPKMDEISMVSLSTTLATNSVVEGRGAVTGLIYMGADLEEDVPAAVVRKVSGRFDIMGREKEPVDINEIRTVMNEMKGKVDALAVSGYASVRNPEHEQEVKRLAEEILDVPVVCAHQLTSALGFHLRTVTAVLNGRLIPVIDRLLKSTEKVLSEYGVNAPVMIVRGDGTLMTDEYARDKPIETILSGPAASVIGGLALTGKKDGIVIDMGGTTTDIASITGGAVNIKKEGARVGGWLTRVQAAEISTFGIGGDSRIYLDRKGELRIGPEKVWPLCVAGSSHPQLIHELRSFKRVGEMKNYFPQEADCYMYIGDGGEERIPGGLSESEEKILEKLKERPHGITYLAELIGRDPETVDLTELVEKGVLARISLTPTDVLHIKGEYNVWNRELSKAGLDILANRLGLTPVNFLDMVEKAINSRLALSCIQSCGDFEGEELDFAGSPEMRYLMERAFGNVSSQLIMPEMKLKKPLIALGAPAGAWLTRIKDLLGTEVVVPENADVANAYGAAAGQITQNVELLISLDKGKFILNTPWSRDIYSSKDEAVFYAIHEGRKHIEHRLRDSGCSRWTIDEKSSDIMIEAEEVGNKIYMGTKMTITGTGNLL